MNWQRWKWSIIFLFAIILVHFINNPKKWFPFNIALKKHLILFYFCSRKCRFDQFSWSCDIISALPWAWGVSWWSWEDAEPAALAATWWCWCLCPYCSPCRPAGEQRQGDRRPFANKNSASNLSQTWNHRRLGGISWTSSSSSSSSLSSFHVHRHLPAECPAKPLSFFFAFSDIKKVLLWANTKRPLAATDGGKRRPCVTSAVMWCMCSIAWLCQSGCKTRREALRVAVCPELPSGLNKRRSKYPEVQVGFGPGGMGLDRASDTK